MINLAPLAMMSAAAFWRDKVKLSPGQFARLADEAKTRAFAVSGIAKGEELSSVYAAIQRAIESGTSFGDFKKDCGAIFEKRGWTGEKAWRVDNIFRTNIQTAYNVGRYQEMKDAASERPYWQYRAVNDSRTRPAHAALHGKVFPADHPFWDTWYPPNGYRCRCGVVTLSAREVERDGLKVEDRDLTGRLVEPVDPRTGARMPARPLMPDPGFSSNPGKTVWGGVVDNASKSATWKTVPGLKTASDYRRPTLGNVRPADIADIDESAFLPAGKDDDFYKNEFSKRYGDEKVVKDALGDPAILSLRTFLVDKSPGVPEQWKFGKQGHGMSIPLMAGMLKDPFEIWLTPQRDEAGRIRLAKRYIGAWKTADRKRIAGLAVFEVAGGVFQGVTNFVPLQGKADAPDLKYVDGQRRGLLLFKKG